MKCEGEIELCMCCVVYLYIEVVVFLLLLPFTVTVVPSHMPCIVLVSDDKVNFVCTLMIGT